MRQMRVTNDVNRMQLTSQRATQTGGPANGLMNLTYGYQAWAGQMGAGSTAGNAGQLTSISGTIGALTESAAYTHDGLLNVLERRGGEFFFRNQCTVHSL